MPKKEEPKIEVPEATAPEADPIPTEAEARDVGLSATEIKSAKEHGLLAEESKATDETKDEGTGDDDVEGDEQDVGVTKESESDENAEGKEEQEKQEKETKAADVLLDEDLSPEKEHEAISKFSDNEKALYFRRKKDKLKRQSAESERDHTLIKLKAQEKENEVLRARLEAVEIAKKSDKATDELGLEDEKVPEEKPLTVKDLDERDKRKQEESDKIQEARRERARKLADAHKTLELDAKMRYTDFEDTTKLATEIVQAQSEGRLNELFPDPRTASRISRRVQELLTGLVNADEYKEGEYNPADIAYELGQSHPKYGKPSSTANGKGQSTQSGKDQALSPEDVDKLARRRTPSAALTGGGGRRMVSYDDLTLEDAAKLSDQAFRKLPKEVRERILSAS